MTQARVVWTWSDTAQDQCRDMKTLSTQKTREVTDVELKYLEKDSSMSLEAIQYYIDNKIPFDLEDEQQIFSPALYDFTGFHQTSNVSKWTRLINDWLPLFDPRRLLTRRIEAEAPIGAAAVEFVECVRAITNLLQQTEAQTDSGQYCPTDTYDQLQMVCRCLPILLLRVPAKASAADKIKRVRHNCSQFLRGQWRALVAAAEYDFEQANTKASQYAQAAAQGQMPDASKKKVDTVLNMARKLQYSRAMHILRSPGCSTAPLEEILQQLEILHPDEEVDYEQVDQEDMPKPDKGTFDFIDGPWLDKQIQKSKAGAALDQWGWDTKEMWAPLRRDPDLLHDIAIHWIKPLAVGYLPRAYKNELAGGRLVALSKHPKPGIRPICISDTWRRLTAKGLLTQCQGAFSTFFQDSNPTAIQFGGAVKDGAANMLHLLQAFREAAECRNKEEAAEIDPIVILTLDIKNAFNTLLRASMHKVLMEQPALRAIWPIIWGHIQAHYGVKGTLRFYHSGKVYNILSQTGVQQGDPLGSTLFAATIQPILIKIATTFDAIVVTAYADNVTLSGPMSQVCKAYHEYCIEARKVGLELNPSDSQAHIPGWEDKTFFEGHQMEIQQQEAPETGFSLSMPNGDKVPISTQGLKILGCPIGVEEFCKSELTCIFNKISSDLDLLCTFPHLHQRMKMAIFCCNTRATYFLRAMPLSLTGQLTPNLDSDFERFIAETLGFPKQYKDHEYRTQYDNALKQCRLGIKQGGIGMTSSSLIAPAASYVSQLQFISWFHATANRWENSTTGMQDIQWIAVAENMDAFGIHLK